MIKAIAKTTMIFRPKRTKVNRQPKEEISNSNRGIRILALEQRKSSTFEILLPFLSSTPATGNSAYKGMAVITPNSKAINTPLKPDFSPINFIMVSRSIHISIRPIHTKIGVSMNRKPKKVFACEAQGGYFCLRLINQHNPIDNDNRRREPIFFQQFFYSNTSPIIKAMAKANRKARAFRRMAAFFPRYFISIGRVTRPTIVRVEMKTEICEIPAPLLSSSAAIGNATSTGTNATAPNKEAISIPKNPLSAPMTCCIVSGVTTANKNSTNRRMAINCGNTFINIFHALLRDNAVFFLSFIKDTQSKTAVMT